MLVITNSYAILKTSISYEELLNLIRQDKSQAYKIFYRKYAPTINGLIRRVITNEQISEKLFFEIVTNSWKNIAAGENCSLFLHVLSTTRKAISSHFKASPISRKYVREDVFDLIFFYGHTYDDVALILQVPINEVKLRFCKSVRSFSVEQ